MDRLKISLQENHYILPSYQLYNGMAGFQDYGILGTIVKNKLLNNWRQYFISDNIYEIETPNIVMCDILKNSGHIDRFTDYMVQDKRADHLAKEWFSVKYVVIKRIIFYNAI